MTRPTVSSVQVSACRIPTDFPESDGTIAWNETTVVVVRLAAGSCEGFGYSYADAAAAHLIRAKLGEVVVRIDPMNIPGAWQRMQDVVRNPGRPGIASHAIAAVDVALWDLKAKLLGLPQADLLGRVHGGIAVHGSDGFTSYPEARLCDQLSGWVREMLHGEPVANSWQSEEVHDALDLFLSGKGCKSDCPVNVDMGGYADRQGRVSFPRFQEADAAPARALDGPDPCLNEADRTGAPARQYRHPEAGNQPARQEAWRHPSAAPAAAVRPQNLSQHLPEADRGQRTMDFDILDNGCCGMAGPFGYITHKYEVSKKIYEHELAPAIDDTPRQTHHLRRIQLPRADPAVGRTQDDDCAGGSGERAPPRLIGRAGMQEGIFSAHGIPIEGGRGRHRRAQTRHPRRN